jgi:hypothetical protein
MSTTSPQGTIRRGIVGLTIAVMAAPIAFISLPAQSAHADVVGACAAIRFIGVRGSGEVPVGPVEVTMDTANYDQSVALVDSPGKEIRGLGNKLEELVNGDVIQNNAAGYGVTSVTNGLADFLNPDIASTVQVDSLIYPASDVSLLYGGPAGVGAYMASVDLGVNYLVQELKSDSVACPDQKFILAGYSQGAMVVHEALNQLSSEGSELALPQKIAAVLLLADPLRRGYGTGTHLGSAPTDLLAPSSSGIMMTVITGYTHPDLPTALQSVILDYCNVGDAVCSTDPGQFATDVSRSTLGFDIHGGYAASDMSTLALFAAKFLNEADPPSPSVQVTDSALHACLDSQLNLLPSDPITVLDFRYMVGFGCNGVADASPLAYAVNLQSLYLIGSVHDLSFLANHNHLSLLYLSGNRGTDLGSLDWSTLPGLRTLELAQALQPNAQGIVDISPLSVLSHLTRLTLDFDGVSDISPIAGMTDLGQLYMYKNAVRDLTPLAGLQHLFLLYLHDNHTITDISPLANLESLQALALSNNQISNLTPLLNRTSLTFLALDGNQISDISALSNLTNLTTINLDGNSIRDLSPLESLSKLNQLSAQGQIVRLPDAQVGTTELIPAVRDSNGTALTPQIALTADPAVAQGIITDNSATWTSVGMGTMGWSSAYPPQGGYPNFTGSFVQQIDPAPVVVPVTPPKVSGVDAVGSTLSIDPGTWNVSTPDLAYQWQRNGIDIPGATQPTYTLRPDDLGESVTAKVTAVAADFAASTFHTPDLGLVAFGAIWGATPVIVGSAVVGSVLVADPGSWGPVGVLLSYQWSRDGSPIAGATSPTYTPTAEDVGSSLSAAVTGHGPALISKSLVTAASSVVTGAVAGPAPIISGSAAVGQTLSANPGIWSPAPVDLAYQWNRNGSAIAGANGSAYTLTSADLGASLTVSVTGSKLTFIATTATSAPTSAVASGVLTPGTVVISPGSATVGHTLSAVTTAWSPTPLLLTFQWNRNGLPVAGATAQTYLLRTADAGNRITVTATGSKTGYVTTSVTSPLTAMITGGTLTDATPTIRGMLRVGNQITVHPGTWGPPPVAFTYLWKRDGTPISGATGSNYRLKIADRGHKITVTVTGHKVGFVTWSRTSGSTAAIR